MGYHEQGRVGGGTLPTMKLLPNWLLPDGL